MEIYGPEASGKTTLALHVVASSQKSGGTAAYIDVEHALEPAYAQALGVNIDDLLISQVVHLAAHHLLALLRVRGGKLLDLLVAVFNGISCLVFRNTCLCISIV